jgi:hypothetical protein
MGTHIIWRNPSPPRRAEFKLCRLAGNDHSTIYQVTGRTYQRPFELLRRTAGLAPRRTVGAPPVAPASELVLARW